MRRIALYLHGSSIDTSSLAFAIRFADKLTARLSVIHLKRANEGASTDFREMCRGLPLVSYSETERDSVDVITENGFVHDMTIVERADRAGRIAGHGLQYRGVRHRRTGHDHSAQDGGDGRR